MSPEERDPAAARRARAQALLVELARQADGLVGMLAAKLRGARAPIATVALPLVSIVLLVLLALARQSSWRWVFSLGALASLWLVIVAGGAIYLSRHARPAVAPKPVALRPPWLLGAGALAVAACLASSVTGVVAMTTASSDAPVTEPAPHVGALGASTDPTPADDAPADKRFERSASKVGGGTLHVPPSFRSPDGVFDLLIHFHGSSTVVSESVAAAKLNALVAVINVDEDERYWKRFQVPKAFALLLDEIRTHVEKRGLERARIGRIALSSWSSGYGAITQLIASKRYLPQIDAVLVLEGLHARWSDEKRRRVDMSSLAPLIAFGRQATKQNKLLAITHSGSPIEDFADSGTVADVLLSELEVKREPLTKSPPHVTVRGGAALFPDKKPRWLEAKTIALRGNLHVFGYRGDFQGHHLPHLHQMSVTVLPLLRARWDAR
jgi:hypothetical protein